MFDSGTAAMPPIKKNEQKTTAKCCQNRLIYFTQSLHVFEIKCNVKQRQKRVDELEDDRFGNQMIVVARVSSIILQVVQKYSQPAVQLIGHDDHNAQDDLRQKRDEMEH